MANHTGPVVASLYLNALLYRFGFIFYGRLSTHHPAQPPWFCGGEIKNGGQNYQPKDFEEHLSKAQLFNVFSF